MKFLVLLVATAACLGLAQTSSAQSLSDRGLGAWYMYFGTNRISEPFSIHSELQVRNWEIASDLNQVLLRTALNYHLNTSTLLSGGYAFAYTDDVAGVSSSREHRVFQQFINRHSLFGSGAEHRIRLEERWIGRDQETTFKGRFRYRLLSNIRLNDSDFFVSLYDEVFLNIDSKVFDQNRLYAALAYTLYGSSSVQAGYLLQTFSGGSQHLFQVMFILNTDLR